MLTDKLQANYLFIKIYLTKVTLSRQILGTTIVNKGLEKKNINRKVSL